MEKYIIFDMDGVLVDSEPMHKQIIAMVFRQLGIGVLTSYLFSLSGMSEKPMWRKVKQDFSLSDSVEDLVRLHQEIFAREFPSKEVFAVEGVVDVIKELHRQGWHLSVASSSTLTLIEYFTEKIGVRSYFDFLVSGTQFKESKPSPDIFLNVAERYGISPSHFWVVEDSHFGVTAAKRAGMKCIGYCNPHSGNQDLSQADFQIDKMRQLCETLVGDNRKFLR